MKTQQIFGLQVLLSFVVSGLVAKWYVTPRLASLPRQAALQPLLVLHATRHMGMVFLVPTVVGSALPAAFAVPAAYGDLLAGLLALATLVALRARAPIALPLAWWQMESYPHQNLEQSASCPSSARFPARFRARSSPDRRRG